MALLWFVAILALIPLVLWMLKRTPLGATAAGGAMRTIAVLPVGPGQRLMTVEVGQGDDRQWLVLGVTATQITTLHTMPPQAEAGTPATTPVPAFAQLLQRATGRTPGAR